VDEPTAEGFIEIASRASTIRELQLLWRNAFQMDLLTPEVENVMRQRAAWVKEQSNITRSQ
jgi:hypothetical protein